MVTALAVKSGLDPGKIVRTMGGEYVGANRNVNCFEICGVFCVKRRLLAHLKNTFYRLPFQTPVGRASSQQVKNDPKGQPKKHVR